MTIEEKASQGKEQKRQDQPKERCQQTLTSRAATHSQPTREGPTRGNAQQNNNGTENIQPEKEDKDHGCCLWSLTNPSSATEAGDARAD